MLKLPAALLPITALFLLAACATRHKGPVSDHFDGRKFFMPNGNVTKSFWQVLKWKWSSTAEKWPDLVPAGQPAHLPRQVSSMKAHVTFVNHATVLVQTENFNFITDPVWSKRVSPVKWAGPTRVREPGVSLEQLPTIHAVLISHNHYDHLDLETLKWIEDKFHPRYFVPLGDKGLLEKNGMKDVVEMDWWDTQQLQGARITFLPAQHWSARGMFDRNLSLWGSYGIEVFGQRIYFGGDSGYGSHYVTIREKWGPPDFSFLPIGAYEPRWFMKDQHMNPEDAVKAAVDLGSRRNMGIHFGTFQLTDEGLNQPAEALAQARQKQGWTETEFFTLNEGASIEESFDRKSKK